MASQFYPITNILKDPVIKELEKIQESTELVKSFFRNPELQCYQFLLMIVYIYHYISSKTTIFFILFIQNRAVYDQIHPIQPVNLKRLFISIRERLI